MEGRRGKEDRGGKREDDEGGDVRERKRVEGLWESGGDKAIKRRRSKDGE